MPDGIDTAAMLLLIALLAAWARQRACDERRNDIECEHAARRRVHNNLDRWYEADYRYDLRVELKLADMLDDRAAA